MDRFFSILNHPVVLVGIGGALGANGRYWLGLLAVRLFGISFPWGTLAVNVLGSLILGFVVVWLAEPPSPTGRAWRLLLGVGFCGGFTTFSTFSVETIGLIKAGRSVTAAAYVIASVAAGLAAVWLAVRLAEETE